MKIKVDSVLPNPDQPRTLFDEAELEGLSQSIKENGLIQPIIVEQVDDSYILIDGERRWRAHQIAGLTQIDAVVRPVSNHRGAERLTHALVANIQRSAMGFIDEAKAYQKLMGEFGTLEAVAKKTGMSTATISGRLSLLDLGAGTQKLYNLKKLPFDLSVIAVFKRLDKDSQDQLASTAVTRGWKTTSILRAGTHMYNKTGRKYVPRERQEKELPVIKGKFDALAMAEKKLPTHLKAAARETCQSCPLYKEASPRVCRQCPLPDFLNRVDINA